MSSEPCLLLMPWVFITSIKKIACAQELGSLRENVSRCPGHLRQGLLCCRSAPFLLEPLVPRSDHTNSNSQWDPRLSQRQEPCQSWERGREATEAMAEVGGIEKAEANSRKGLSLKGTSRSQE